MRRHLLMIMGLTLAASGPLEAATFTRAPIAPEYGLDALTRSVAHAQVGRDVFSNPYATVTISNVDLYDRFPYVEARHFQIVSDPRWDRLVMGELGRGLSAYDGKGSPLGGLSSPRGMAVDEQNRVYVADTGHDRVLVLQAATEFDQITLTPVYAIEGLRGPYDVAFSDGGTPFHAGDDYLFVTDSGRNRVAAFAVQADQARLISTIGDLGSGRDHFAGPMAITVGRIAGAVTPDVYVADAHNHRLVHLRLDAGHLQWVGEADAAVDVITSLDTDQWGNVYAAAPQQGVVRKFSPTLQPVADLRDGLTRPTAFHIPFYTVRDHRNGTTQRVGQPNALSIDQWTDISGVRLWNLGVGIDGLAVLPGGAPTAHFTLTDQAAMTLEVTDPSSGRVLSRRDAGLLPAGVHQITLQPADLNGVAQAGDLTLRLTAASSYASGPIDVAEATFHVNGGGTVSMPTQPALLGNWPNPSRSSTRIAFVLPQTTTGRVALGVFDASGRRIRSFDRAFAPGLNEVLWDGTDDSGHGVRPGIYFYRLDVGDASFKRRMAVVR